MMPFVSGPTAALVESTNVTCVHRTTIAECEAAATQLGLSDTSASLDGEIEISDSARGLIKVTSKIFEKSIHKCVFI